MYGTESKHISENVCAPMAVPRELRFCPGRDIWKNRQMGACTYLLATY